MQIALVRQPEGAHKVWMHPFGKQLKGAAYLLGEQYRARSFFSFFFLFKPARSQELHLCEFAQCVE